MKTVDSFNFSGHKALVRVDFNVPLNEKFEITDDTRMRATIPTITKILNEGGSAILMSHLGRPKEGPVDKFSLRHLVTPLSLIFGRTVKLADDCIGDQAVAMAQALLRGEGILLGNVRFEKAGEKGDEEFARQLARVGDVWVNEAFGAAHGADASASVVGKFLEEKVAGYVLQAEI